MTYPFIIVALLLVILGPGVWVKYVLKKYSEPADRYRGTGASLARHLLDKNGVPGWCVQPVPSKN